MKNFFCCTLILASGLAAVSVHSCELAMQNGWVRMAPPMAANWAAYGVFKNAGTTPFQIGTISSPQFQSVEIHETFHDGDIARMRRVDPVEVPASESVNLKPHGKHLMLMGPKTRLEPGMQVELSIEGCNPPLTVQLPVRADDSEASPPNAHHHH